MLSSSSFDSVILAFAYAMKSSSTSLVIYSPLPVGPFPCCMQVLVLHMDCPLHLIHFFSKIESLFFLGTWNPSK
jgi:hypothetical protein